MTCASAFGGTAASGTTATRRPAGTGVESATGTEPSSRAESRNQRQAPSGSLAPAATTGGGGANEGPSTVRALQAQSAWARRRARREEDARERRGEATGDSGDA